jgi:predicted acetyltransferase
MSGLEVVPAMAADKETIANLIQLYLYDMTDEGVWPIGADGRYAYEFLERFWQHPYLLRLDGELAGFALVIDKCVLTGEKPCWFMAEFFVLRGYRRRGIGRQAVAGVLARHPGRWHVAATHSHVRSEAFWARALDGRVGLATRELTFEGEEWRLRSFAVD